MYAASASLALDGIATPPELEELGRQYIAGFLSLAQFQQACFDYARQIA